MMNNSDKKKILIIEDESLLSEMYTDAFKKEGYEVVTAESEEEATEAVEGIHPDFILLDIILPGQNGIVFLRKQKANPMIADIPVVVFSNLDSPKIRQEALQLGAEAYIIKTSYTPQELIDKVRKYLK